MRWYIIIMLSTHFLYSAIYVSLHTEKDKIIRIQNEEYSKFLHYSPH